MVRNVKNYMKMKKLGGHNLTKLSRGEICVANFIPPFASNVNV